MKSSQLKPIATFILGLLAGILVAKLAILQPHSNFTPGDNHSQTDVKPTGRTFIEFSITQDMELIMLTSFSEPPQFAIWLEHPETHELKTIFVTHRSGTGDLVGKAECPGCLPLWFSIYERETGITGMPTPESPAPQAVTGATPWDESFKITREVEPGSKWICWMEMNLAGDFNSRYEEYNEEDESIDWDYSGQPPLVYRCEITAIAGAKLVPELYGQVDMNKPFEEMIQPLSEDLTTAKDLFKSIKIRIVQTKAEDSI